VTIAPTVAGALSGRSTSSANPKFSPSTQPYCRIAVRKTSRFWAEACTVGIVRVRAQEAHPRHRAIWAAHQERLTADNAESCKAKADACQVRDHAAPAQAVVQGRYWTHCVTWAASAGGLLSPRASAVLTLICMTNLVGPSTGRSAGLAPRKMRST
jgi:hypothetical protein